MSSLFLKQAQQAILCDLFNQLLDYGKENFLFYKKFYEKFAAIHSLDELCQLPFTDKKSAEINLLVNQVLANNPPAYFETSGTSGTPFPVIPDFRIEKSNEFAQFISEWLDLNNNPIKKGLIALPFEMNPIGLKYFFALNQLGITAIPTGVRTHLCPPAKVLEIIQRLSPELLIARPLETLRYAEAMLANGISPQKSSIKKIILTGEIISKSKFKRIQDLYGNAEVYGVYGLTELDSGGLVSCSQHQYHLPSKPYLIVELLKDDFMTPVTQEGDIGNLILTNTHQNYMPLLRYKTGDLGRLKHHCECEYDTPVINVMGREADAIYVNQKQIFPIELEDWLFQYDQISCDYQIITDNGHVDLRIELLTSLDQSTYTAFANQLRDDAITRFGLSIRHIEIFMPGHLANKLGIAKQKAGVLYSLDGLNDEHKSDKLQINYCC